MMREDKVREEDDDLQKKGRLHERPFTSTVPLIGTLIVAFRSFWNSIAAKWVLRQVIQQQNEFNSLTIQRLQELESQVILQMVDQDKEQVHLLRETAELSLNLNQINHWLQSLDERLAELELKRNNGKEGE